MQQPGDPGSPWRTRLQTRVAPLCDSCVAGAEVDGGSVALRSSAGVHDVLHASDAVASGLEDLQAGLGEGPCVDAVVGAQTVLVEDLATLRPESDGSRRRWSFFLPQAQELGVRSLFAFPLRIGSIVLGSLELYRRDPGPLRAAQLSVALQAADEMSAAVLDQVRLRDDGRHAPGSLPGAGDVGAGIGRAAATVHQAAGMVMVQTDSSIEEAMAMLRAAAFAEETVLVDLASEVVRGRRRFGKGLR